MKIAICVLSCMLAVLIQQSQAIQYGKCDAPSCPNYTVFDNNNCLCNTNRDAVCPEGYGPIVKGHGLCACEKLMIPFCKAGFEFNSKTCSCTLKQPPTCPHGASLTPHSALCMGTADVMCPPGAELKEGCMCFSARLRECPKGRLSSNGCTCEGVQTQPPTCGKGCELSYDGECTCESTAIECYSHNGYCEDYSYHVGRVEDCCHNPLQERSYRDAKGVCRRCPTGPGTGPVSGPPGTGPGTGPVSGPPGTGPGTGPVSGPPGTGPGTGPVSGPSRFFN